MRKDDKPNADATAAQPAAAPTAPEELAPAAVAAADAEEIVALCAIAGLPATRAHDFIAQKKSVQEVRAELIEARAKTADNTEIVSQIQPHSGVGARDKSADVLKAVVDEMKGGK